MSSRAERRNRRELREEEEWNAQALAQMDKDAGLEGHFEAVAEFAEGDEVVPRDEIAGQWDRGEALPEGQAKAKSDPWTWARFGTVQDVAALFSVHWKTVELWRRKVGLPFVRIGGVIRYALSDFLQWASARKEGF